MKCCDKKKAKKVVEKGYEKLVCETCKKVLRSQKAQEEKKSKKKEV